MRYKLYAFDVNDYLIEKPTVFFGPIEGARGYAKAILDSSDAAYVELYETVDGFNRPTVNYVEDVTR